MDKLKVFVVGVAGGSGSGKTTFARLAQQTLGVERSAVLAQDSFYFDRSRDFDHDGGAINFDHPSALDFGLMAWQLKLLKSGQVAQVPIYDFKTHARSFKTLRVDPRPIVLVEGTLILQDSRVRELLDFSVFVEVPEPIRFARRLKRDVSERGRTPSGVREQFEAQVKPMHDLFVEPSREFANLIVSGEKPFDPWIEKVFLEDLNPSEV